ncbi:MAG TPA: acyltransferase [Gemmatimonadales bacterium]
MSSAAGGGNLGRAIRNPGRAVGVLLELLRGHMCRLSCRLRGVRFEAGRNLRVQGRLIVKGPGRVVIGDDVTIGMTVTPWTYDRDAEIRIGSGSFLNGTRFGCARRITIGRDCILADAQIMDTDFHSTHVDRKRPDSPVRVAPVEIGDNVWLAARVGVLPGTTIGRDSVVGFGAVCSGELPAGMLIAGNPARPIRPVPGAEMSAAASEPTREYAGPLSPKQERTTVAPSSRGAPAPPPRH